MSEDRSAKKVPRRASQKKRGHKDDAETDPQIRAENEDDDGYDPYSDRAPATEPLFERDPWT